MTVAITASLQVYLAARQSQRLDHTDETLCCARTEAHDEFLWTLRVSGVAFEERERWALADLLKGWAR